VRRRTRAGGRARSLRCADSGGYAEYGARAGPPRIPDPGTGGGGRGSDDGAGARRCSQGEPNRVDLLPQIRTGSRRRVGRRSDTEDALGSGSLAAAREGKRRWGPRVRYRPPRQPRRRSWAPLAIEGLGRRRPRGRGAPTGLAGRTARRQTTARSVDVRARPPSEGWTSNSTRGRMAGRLAGRFGRHGSPTGIASRRQTPCARAPSWRRQSGRRRGSGS